MDKEDYINDYKNKFEYLNFNEEIIKMFEEAYEKAKNAKRENFNNQLEYEFILKLIEKARNGDKEIYDNLSLYHEKYNAFYLRKNKDKLKDFSNLKQKEYYDKAFKFTIDNYIEGQLFYKELVHNIILVYKNQLPLKGGLNMKYDLSIKSIYDLFSKYDNEIIKMILEISIDNEPSSISILMKKYGKKFDGINSEMLTYNEKVRLENILSRIEQKIELAEYMINNGKTYNEVRKILKKLKDVALINAITDMKKNKNSNFEIRNISDIKKKYSVNDNVLKIAIDFDEDEIEKKVFCYTYGFNVQKMSAANICKLLEINSYLYNKYLNSILNKMNHLVNQAKEYYELLDEKNPVIKEPAIIINVKKEPIKKEKISTKKKETFFEYFYEENMSDEKKEEIKLFIIKCLDINKECKAHELIVRRYGNNYCTLNKNVKFNKEENNIYEGFKCFIRQKLKSGNYENQLKIKSRFKSSFFEYFYEDNMPEEKKEEIKLFIINYLNNNKENKAYGLVVRKYGNDYCTLNKNEKFTKEENNIYEGFKCFIRQKLKSCNYENQLKIKSRFKSSFFEYFYEDDMSEEKKEEIKLFIINYLNNNKENKAYGLVVRKYGNDYCTLNKNETFTKEENKSYENFKYFIRNRIKTGDMKIRVKKVSFFDWFYEDNMPDKEKEEVRIFVREYLDNNKGCQAYKLVVRRYGENYDTLNKNETFTKEENCLYTNFKASIKRKLKNKNNLKLNSSKIEHSYNKKVKKEKEVVESQEVKIIPSALNYTDTIIYKLTELKYSLGKISLLLNVDTDFILKSYISNLDYYSLSFVINTIMEYNPKYLINIFSSNYFDELLNILSPIEKQLIYYLILAKNNMISLDEISTIMNISVEDIINYQIYTREEKYNELNDYISFNKEKKKVLTSKM